MTKTSLRVIILFGEETDRDAGVTFLNNIGINGTLVCQWRRSMRP